MRYLISSSFSLYSSCDLFPFQGRQALEGHFQDGVGLDFGQLEPFHQGGARRFGGARGLDEGDHLVDVIEGDEKPLQDVGAQLGPLEQELGAAGDDLLAVIEVVDQHLLEGEQAGLAIDQGDHDQAKGDLHRRLPEELGQDGARLDGAGHLDGQAHALAVGLVAQVGDPFQLAVAHQLGDALDEAGLVDLVGQLGDDDAAAVAAHLFDVKLGLDGEPAAAHGVGVEDDVVAVAVVALAGVAVDNAAGGKVGALDEPGQVLDRDVVEAGHSCRSGRPGRRTPRPGCGVGCWWSCPRRCPMRR